MRLITVFIAVCLLVTSCNAAAPQRQGTDNNNRENHGGNDASAKNNDVNAQGVRPLAETPAPNLAGGPEHHVRKVKPASNWLMQRKYPNTVVLQGLRTKKQIALTFDDGPDRRFTPAVLDVLKKHGVKGTFFLMGSRAKALPDVTSRIAREGHVIGNHTYWHPKLFEQSIGRVDWEVSSTQQAIQDIAGYAPRLFRAPYGGLDDDIVGYMQRRDFTVVGWNVDSQDWKQIPADQIIANCLPNIGSGSIVLMHTAGNWNQILHTHEALDRMIPKLKQQGYRFVTVSEMFGIPKSK
ncbi:polysaccharide deacetylase family protein [Paenibacillus alkalitolerans]|uniref:polysaccharide deacetylase family protein n=1 Tax=Paenibacillus alkalitolerans TaxID=2799335 RepID=UPI0018F50678|nr:polysaccharide deacetylase family protein [Paenibacillus alkalitolerans]